jgi:hypothetical protein
MSATVSSEFVAITWHPASALAGYADFGGVIAPTIGTINGVPNTGPATSFSVSPSAGIVITGTNLDLVTAIQFEDYGPDNDGWPNYAPVAPTSTPNAIIPDPADTLWPTFTIDSPTQITMSATDISNFLSSSPGPAISPNTWYKLVLTY